MEKKENPTHAQFGGLRDTAIAMEVNKGIITSLIDDGSFTNLMKDRRDQVRADEENVRTFELTAKVNQYRGWEEALEAAGPDTPSSFNVRKVGDLYPPVSTKEETVDFILRNFPKGNGSWDKALAWAKDEGLKLTNPREVFAVVEQHDLRKVLGVNWMYLVTTTECSFEGYRRAVYVGLDGSLRSADLFELEVFDVDNDWFLFRK